MKQIKIGNRIKNLIIRNASSMPLAEGDPEPICDNQPYTILSDIDAEFEFEYLTSTQSTWHNVLHYSNYKLSSILLKKVPLTDKIMNLLFKRQDNLTGSLIEDVISDYEGHIFLNKVSSDSQVRNMFIFDANGNIEALENIYPEEVVLKPNTNYKIIYELGNFTGWSFNKNNRNIYLNLDMETVSNNNDSTSKFFIHADKCSVEVEHSLHFTEELSYIDIKVIVLGDSWLGQQQ